MTYQSPFIMRILVIEDEKEVRDFLRIGLRERGYVVDCAADGQEGSYAARTNHYNLILLDNIMPKKHGVEVCKELRENGTHTPIIMLTVSSDSSQKVQLLRDGADDYITKPFSFEELLARIQVILRRGRYIQAEILTVGDLKLDRNNQSLTIGEKDIYLRKKEFQLLEYFMMNQGRVVTRAEILEHVWESSMDPFSNTIESHILRLRRKIETKKNKLIFSVPGRGYKLEV